MPSAITIKTVQDGELKALPAGALLAEELSKAVQSATSQAFETAEQKAALMLEQVKAITARMQDEVKASLVDAIQAKQQILSVEIGGKTNNLTMAASPHLGRMLVHAKLKRNTMLVGPAGCGKTTMALQAAQALGLPFGHISLEPGTSITALYGRQTPGSQSGFSVPEKCFFSLYKQGGVFLLDEMDNADGSFLTAINTALANGECTNTITGEIAMRHPDFYCVGGCNTFGKGGNSVYTRNRLDGATLNRFIIIKVDYNPMVEKLLCPSESIYRHLLAVRAKLAEMRSDEILSTRNLENVHLESLAGIPIKDALESLSAGWPDELVKSTGILNYAESKPAKAEKAQAKPEEPAKPETESESEAPKDETPKDSHGDEHKRCVSAKCREKGGAGHLWKRHFEGGKCYCGCTEYTPKGGKS